MKTKVKKIAALFLAVIMIATLVPGQLSARAAEEERYSIMLDDQQYAKVGGSLTVRPKLYSAKPNESFSEIEIDESVFSFTWRKGIWSDDKNEYVWGDVLSTDVDFVIDDIKESDICTDETYVAFRCVVSKDGEEIAYDEFVINPWEKGHSAKVAPVFANEGDSITFRVEIYDCNNEKVPESDSYWETHEFVWYKCVYDKVSYSPQFEELGKGKSYTTVVKAEDIYHIDNEIFAEYSCQVMEEDIIVTSGGTHIYQKGESFRAERIECMAQVGNKATLTAKIYDMETEKQITPSECGLEIEWKKTIYNSSIGKGQTISLGKGESFEIASVTEEDFDWTVSYAYDVYKNGRLMETGYVTLTRGEQPPETTVDKETDPSVETTTPQNPVETTTPQNPVETTTPQQPVETTTPQNPVETTKVSDTQQTTVSTIQTDKNGASISAPGKVKKFKVKKLKNRKLKLTWKKMKKVSGYQVFYATNKKFKKGVKKVQAKASAKGITIRRLKKKKTYYIKMRAYNKVGKQVKYGVWTKPKKIKIK